MKLKDSVKTIAQSQRLYQLPVPVIGLTGGIATGKSTVANLLSQKNIAVINADHLVKKIYQLDETKTFIKNLYPAAISGTEVNFKVLREKFFTDTKVKKDTEDFIYQRLPRAFNEAFQALSDPKFVIYDVPLLFEKKMESLFDLTVLVYAPRKIQRARLMERDGHLEEMAETILKQQIDIEEKKSKAQYIINNSNSKEELAAETLQFLQLYIEL